MQETRHVALEVRAAALYVTLRLTFGTVSCELKAPEQVQGKLIRILLQLLHTDVTDRLETTEIIKGWLVPPNGPQS